MYIYIYTIHIYAEHEQSEQNLRLFNATLTSKPLLLLAFCH